MPSTELRVTPYFNAAHSPGVGGQVPADRRDLEAARIRRVEQPQVRHGPAHVRVDDARFDHDRLVRRIDLADTGHPLEADHQAVVESGRSAGQAGTGSRATTGVPVELAHRMMVTTSSVVVGLSTASGLPAATRSARSRE